MAYFDNNDAHVQGVSDGGLTTCASPNNCYCVDCDGGYAWDADAFECYLDSPDLAVTGISVDSDPCSVSTATGVTVTVENIGSQSIQSVGENVFGVLFSFV